METTATTNTTATTSTAGTTATNPKAQLDRDAFMKLLLTELQYQDPTNPMDSDKMLTQTSQLATLETQESTNKIMKELAAQLKEQSSSGVNAYAISAIGKQATVGDISLKVEDDTTSTKFDLNFEKEVASGTITISDDQGKVVRTMDIESGSKGVTGFSWDVKDSKGNKVENGNYGVTVDYKDFSNKSHSIISGTYLVEAVKFVDGVAQLKLGSNYIPITEVNEFSNNEE